MKRISFFQVILEVGEWRGFLSEEDKNYVRENGLESLMHSGLNLLFLNNL